MEGVLAFVSPTTPASPSSTGPQPPGVPTFIYIAHNILAGWGVNLAGVHAYPEDAPPWVVTQQKTPGKGAKRQPHQPRKSF